MEDNPLKHCEKCKTLIIGNSKPLLNYVTAVISVLNEGYDHVYLVARGKAIKMMIDMYFKTKASFISTLYYNDNDIEIDGEQVTTRDGRVLTLPIMRMVVRRN